MDDSLQNAIAAEKLGWRSVHFDESSEGEPRFDPATRVTTISSMLDLHKVWHELFL